MSSLLDQSSYNPTSHKATTIKALTRREQLICDSPNALQDENDYLQRVFHKNNCSSDFIKLNTYKNTDERKRNEQPGNSNSHDTPHQRYVWENLTYLYALTTFA